METYESCRGGEHTAGHAYPDPNDRSIRARCSVCTEIYEPALSADEAAAVRLMADQGYTAEAMASHVRESCGSGGHPSPVPPGPPSESESPSPSDAGVPTGRTPTVGPTGSVDAPAWMSVAEEIRDGLPPDAFDGVPSYRPGPERDCPHGHQIGKCDTCELHALERRLQAAQEYIDAQRRVFTPARIGTLIAARVHDVLDEIERRLRGGA